LAGHSGQGLGMPLMETLYGQRCFVDNLALNLKGLAGERRFPPKIVLVGKRRFFALLQCA
jgi:hypothetical protein